MTLDIRALIFDLDGVITDTAEYHYRSWKRLADEEGLPFTRHDNEALRGVSRRESLALLLKGRPIDEPTAQVWMTRKNGYYLDYLDDITPADRLPGVDTLFADARARGMTIGLGSASRNAPKVLVRLDMSDSFDAVGDGSSVVNPKPAPDLFVWVAGRLNVNPTQAIVFEDAEAGIDAALAGGFWTVAIGAATGGKGHVKLASMAEADLTRILAQLAG
ncbi:MAG: beta-phosphoglucomutase [Chloroflexota bacterium]|nr:beta-phosphoglucomutase [Chloroflexota bacterium]